ncbi:MAG: alpha/beta hydrolase [Terrimicrobiaceae bacterium]
MGPAGQKVRRFFRIFLGGILVVVGALLLVLLFPIMRPSLSFQAPPPPLTFEETVKAIRASIANTPPEVSPEGMPLLFEHGRPTPKVFVFLHGLSNCPKQFAELGRLLFERGHTVYIPRTPYHGEKNLLTESFGRLTAQQMLDSGNEAADLARGLGQDVTVAGLSINGATTAWMAQNRSDLYRSVLLAPFLAPNGLPQWTIRPLERLLLRLPNFFIWWNPVLKEKNPGPPYAYPRFPTRVIGETMWLGQDVVQASRKEAPRSPSILVVTSASDLAANNALTAILVENWRKLRPEGIETCQFPKDQKVPHDFIDPNQPDQQTAISYPKLIELLER